MCVSPAERLFAWCALVQVMCVLPAERLSAQCTPVPVCLVTYFRKINPYILTYQ